MSDSIDPTDDRWSAYSDEQLSDLEESLYDDEVAGRDVWFFRDQVLWEMNRRRALA